MEPIRLTEYVSSPIDDLTEEEVAFIRSELAAKLVLTRTLDGGWLLNPQQYAGVVILPTGRRVECMPKVALVNLFYMLAVSGELPFLEQTASYDQFEDLLSFLATYFADLVEDHLRRGLYRTYVEEEDNLSVVRGRIAFAEDARRNYVMRHRVYCRFSEFTWDVPENQVLRQVARRLAGWDFGRDLRSRLIQLDGALDEVTIGGFTSADLGRFRYHRQNEPYRPIHQLCRLLLEGMSVSEQLGEFDFRSYLVDMNQLFEYFITELLRREAPGGVQVRDQVGHPLGVGNKVRMWADIVIKGSSSALVADCKYKRLAGTGDFEHHDWYQILAYCTAFGFTRGLLLYPRDAHDIDEDVQVMNSPVWIRQMSIDLGKPWPAFQEECSSFAKRVFANL